MSELCERVDLDISVYSRIRLGSVEWKSTFVDEGNLFLGEIEDGLKELVWKVVECIRVVRDSLERSSRTRAGDEREGKRIGLFHDQLVQEKRREAVK